MAENIDRMIDGPAGQKLISEAPEGAPKKVRFGGNRLMFWLRSDRTRQYAGRPHKVSVASCDYVTHRDLLGRSP